MPVYVPFNGISIAQAPVEAWHLAFAKVTGGPIVVSKGIFEAFAAAWPNE
jgi:hypothetical protein